jgi:sigma-B regulation protein RsbU (phosphoserine phosphatase)
MTARLLRAEAGPDTSPVETLVCVNEHLLAMNVKRMFVTILYGIFDQATGEFVYTRAGHSYPMVWDQAGELIPTERSKGQPLGFFEYPLLEARSFKILPGSTLIICSDGVTETEDEKHTFLGTKGLTAILPTLLQETAQGLCDQLVDELAKYCGDIPQSDDITVLAIKALGEDA